mgnify:CR=1 FL=1
MKKQPIFLSLTILCICLATLPACEKEKATEAADKIQSVFTELRDIDGDGIPEMIVGFERDAVRSLPDVPIVLEGSLKTGDLLFESDGFLIQY